MTRWENDNLFGSFRGDWGEVLAADEWDRAVLPFEDEEPRRSGVSPTVRYDVDYEDTMLVFARAASMPEPHGPAGRQGGPVVSIAGLLRTRAPMPYDTLLDLYEMNGGR